VTTRTRGLLRWVIVGVVVVVVLAVAGPFVYIHFIEGPAPAKLTLPTSKTTIASSSESGNSADSLEGTWNVGSGSIVGYRVQEVLIGQNSTAVGRTSKVWGSLVISGSSVTSGSFTVNMASVVSDQSERNASFDGRIMDVSTYPTATFTLGDPISLGSVPAGGAVKHFEATGDLTMHGVTKSITFTLSAERLGDSIYVLADIPILFADWNISNPSVGGFVTTQSSGTLEVLLHLTQGTGNPASSGSSGTTVGGGGPGSPITVPRTTVPPVTIPGK
jgi:polyisoprenoid-binding protein YceI